MNDDRPFDDSIFAQAIAHVLSHEGGFVDDPKDPGGATNFGISLRLARKLGDLDGDGKLDLDIDGDGDVDIDDIRRLTRAQATMIYKTVFWDMYGYAHLTLSLGMRVFDFAVNMGPVPAHTLLQRALRACGNRVQEDGRIGPKTMQACQTVGPAFVIPALRSEAAGFYRQLVAQRPASAKYLEGWLNRAYS